MNDDKFSEDIQKKYEHAIHNAAEVIGKNDLKKVFTKRCPRVYFGTVPTSMPHIGYFVPLLKIRDFLEAGCIVDILIADVHSYLDEGFESTSLVEQRTQFYKHILSLMLTAIGVDPANINFVEGHDIQLTSTYIRDLLKFSTLININTAQKAGVEVVKKTKNPKLSSLIYPLMQVLDEVALDADCQIGNKDQRNIFMMSRNYIEKMGHNHKKCSYVITNIIPSLMDNKKNSSSNINSKIKFYDSNRHIKKKINKAFCENGKINLETDAILAICKYLLFPVFNAIKIKRRAKYNDNITLESFNQLSELWLAGNLSASDLKPAVTRAIIKLINPIRTALLANTHLYDMAYPSK